MPVSSGNGTSAGIAGRTSTARVELPRVANRKPTNSRRRRQESRKHLARRGASGSLRRSSLGYVFSRLRYPLYGWVSGAGSLRVRGSPPFRVRVTVSFTPGTQFARMAEEVRARAQEGRQKMLIRREIHGLLEKGKNFALNQMYAEALETYRSILSKYPDHPMSEEARQKIKEILTLLKASDNPPE